MVAYLIVEHRITDPAKFEDYRSKVGPMIAKHGGRALAKGNAHQFPEGGHWKPELVAITEFPDMESLKAWYNSEEYQPLIALRKQCTRRSRGADHGRGGVGLHLPIDVSLDASSDTSISEILSQACKLATKPRDRKICEGADLRH